MKSSAVDLLVHPSHEQYLQHQLGVAIGAVDFDLPGAIRALLRDTLPKKRPSRRDHFFYTFGERRRCRMVLSRTERAWLERYNLPDRSRTAVERLIEAHATHLGYIIGIHVCGPFCPDSCPQKRYVAKCLPPEKRRANMAGKSRA